MAWAIMRLSDKMFTAMRIGAVNYLNSKPLVYGLEELAPDVRVTYDLPSRLADSLAAGRLDVALVPSVEFFRTPGHRIVSDACVACRGPVLSVKLHFRVPPDEVRRVALDEGSRTSAALTQILLAEMCGVRPQWEPLPIGCGPEATRCGCGAVDWGPGDCGMRSTERQSAIRNRSRKLESLSKCGILGERGVSGPACRLCLRCGSRGRMRMLRKWQACWERRAIRGVRHLDEIAAREAPLIGISEELATRYLRDNLHFTLGREERAGLRRFYELCVAHELAPSGFESC